MTKEELKVMIDETINSNGVRGITGKALNLALTEIVDAMGTTSGGGDEGLKRNDVNFFDYDGTLLYAYTWEEAKALTELPPLPEHDGLEVREWNYTLEDIKAQEGSGFIDNYDWFVGYVRDVVIDGVSYKAYSDDSSLSQMYLLTHEPQVGDPLLFAEYDSESGEYTVYDDEEPAHIAEVINTIGKADVGACVYDSNGDQVLAPFIFIFERGNEDINNRIEYVPAWVVSIPNTITELERGFMKSAACSNELKIPISVTEIDNVYGGAFNGSVTEFPVWWNGVNRTYNIAVNYGISLKIPENFTNVGIPTYYTTRVILHENVECIEYMNYPEVGTLLDFTRATFVPTLESDFISSWSYVIVVPDALYEEWINATNWSDVEDKIYKHSMLSWLK